MPRLVEKRDGLFIVRHFYRDHATWQIDADGVYFLRRRGVEVHDMFSTTLFMQLWMLGMVYTGNRRPAGQPVAWGGPVCQEDIALDARVSLFFRYLHANDFKSAYAFLAQTPDLTVSLQEFTEKLGPRGGPRLSAWKRKALASTPWPDEAWPSVDRAAHVLLDLEFQDASGDRQKHRDHVALWLRIDGVWYLFWKGWPNDHVARET